MRQRTLEGRGTLRAASEGAVPGEWTRMASAIEKERLANLLASAGLRRAPSASTSDGSVSKRTMFGAFGAADTQAPAALSSTGPRESVVENSESNRALSSFRPRLCPPTEAIIDRSEPLDDASAIAAAPSGTTTPRPVTICNGAAPPRSTSRFEAGPGLRMPVQRSKQCSMPN